MKAYAYFQQSCGNVVGVAEIDVPKGKDTDRALEYVYCLLQNIRGSWSFGPYFEGSNDDREGQPNLDHSKNVKFLGEHPVNKRTGKKMGERSMMVGDLITFGGKTYEVDFVGFKEYVEEVA